MRDLHVSLSCTSSCQFGISARSLFSKSIHLNCVPPGVLSFFVAYISILAFACGGLAFFADDQTTVASFASVGVLSGVPQFPLGHLHFDAYARG